MNTPITNLHSKVAQSTAPTKMKSTVVTSNPRAKMDAQFADAIHEAKERKFSANFRKLKSYGGKGWGGP